MPKKVVNYLILHLTSLVSGLLLTNATLVTETQAVFNEQLEIAPMARVNSVSQLLDIGAKDWEFQAAQSLFERYGCTEGYFDKTYRGNQTLTRYEFASKLNVCIEQINKLLTQSTVNLSQEEDLETWKKLQEIFAAELATLQSRVARLEMQTTTLQEQQFSATTKLVGEVIFALTDEFNQPTNNNTVFQERARLNFQSSFTGKDRLHIRIASGNANIFNLTGYGVEAIQTFNFGNTNNTISADWISYFFPIGKNIQGYVAAVGGVHYDYAPTVSSYVEGYGSGKGSLSVFGQRNPIYLIGGGSGGGVTYSFSQNLLLSTGYLADSYNLFDGNYAASAQLTFSPSNQFSIGLTYINAYRQFAIFDTGSNLASVGTNLANGGGFDVGTVPSKVNAYGAEFTYRFNPRFTINGWFSYINAHFMNLGTGDIWTYALTFAFPDLGKKSNLGGIVVGVEPYLGNASQFAVNAKNDVPIHIEGFYQHQINSNISVTPGLIWILSPGQNSENRDSIICTLRTTFAF
ncbi:MULTISPECIES: iron uptake porin [Nostocales]|uniref:Carbohydrate porin n=3 Tax=Nostocales TaxID=1161 RepID=A0A8S9T1A0_9CYAN|nr:iron uptake porin [Tolypothrix bouteillei]KAF3885253.1 carbohydrate porin [Tolypothrix bouteillei VB521301]